MKPGLLLSEAPEPIFYHRCWDCTAIFTDTFDYQKHRKDHHNTIYVWVKHWVEEYTYYDGTKREAHWQFYQAWIELSSEDYYGQMQSPWFESRRPTQRWKVTPQELDNRNNKKCHCGKPKSQWTSKRRHYYCSAECATDWYNKTQYWSWMRDSYLADHDKCEKCNIKTDKLDVDHIIAIVLGGHPWDERNFQALCKTCHKAKTKDDIQILTWWRRESNYDIFVESQQAVLESFLVIQ